MQCINFDEKFQAFTAAWVQDNAARYKNNLDRMEEKMPEVYLQWLNTPADWLDGISPGAYFARFDDAVALVGWMRAYFERAVPVPDQLLERVTALGSPAEEALYALLSDDGAPQEARLTAITLLSEMESVLPLALYVGWISARRAEDERADMAAEALSAMGRAIVPALLSAMDAASEAGQETFLDILCNFPGEDAIYRRTLAAFERYRDKRALYASLLGKLGDARAIPALMLALEAPELGYLDYIELRNAVEALGGEAPVERAFDGDPYYESLRRME